MKKSLLVKLIIASIIPLTTIKTEEETYRPRSYETVDALVEQRQIDWHALFATLASMPDTTVDEYRTKTGFSLVHRAVMVNNFGAAKTLLEKYNANPNTQTPTLGETPLMLACVLGEFAIAKLLLMYGADPYIKDKQGNDSFSYARNNPIVLEILAEYKI